MAKPKFGAKQKVTGGAAKRAARRHARLTMAGKVPAGVDSKRPYTGREARRLKKAAKALPKTKPTPNKPAPKPGFDPLEPLTGRSFEREVDAATRLKFGAEERELGRELASARQQEENVGTYLDDYRNALRESAAKVNEANRLNAEQTASRAQESYEQDKAGVAERNAAASATAANLGRGPVQSTEGSQAVSAQRAQAEQQAARVRGQGVSDMALWEKKQATSVLKKAEAIAQEKARQRRIREDVRNLQKEKGDFRVGERTKAREGEREWAAIQEEFDIERRGQKLEAGATREQQQTERMKARTQKAIANIYAAADLASARAQVRVARLQLKKGKITKNQFRTIRNTYSGLSGGAGDPTPEPGEGASSQGGGGKAGGGGGGQWGGKVDTPPERAKVQEALAALEQRRPGREKKEKIIRGLIANGYTRAAANKAWRKYERKYLNIQRPGNAPSGPGSGQSRPT